ncbi:MAG: hypothetical protein KAG18_06035, partial [Sinobacterium sp.]|nr:hypothetical protein [Sinobacterium sp.]
LQRVQFMDVLILLIAIVLTVGLVVKSLGGKRTYGQRAYTKKVEEAIADGQIDDAERADLDALGEKLGLSPEQITDATTDVMLEEATLILEEVKDTLMMSPEQDKAFRDLCNSYNFDGHYEEARSMLEPYCALWALEHTGTFELYECPVGIRLKKGEICHHQVESHWQQLKLKKNHVIYAGGSIGLKVSKNLTLRLGAAKPVGSETEEMTPISTGVLYITNKRLIFVGEKRSTTITYGRLLDYELFEDGIYCHKSSGKPDFFNLNKGNVAYVDMLLQEL